MLHSRNDVGYAARLSNTSKAPSAATVRCWLHTRFFSSAELAPYGQPVANGSTPPMSRSGARWASRLNWGLSIDRADDWPIEAPIESGLCRSPSHATGRRCHSGAIAAVVSLPSCNCLSCWLCYSVLTNNHPVSKLALQGCCGHDAEHSLATLKAPGRLALNEYRRCMHIAAFLDKTATSSSDRPESKSGHLKAAC